MKKITREHILASTKRVPFSNDDQKTVHLFLQKNRNNSLDTEIAGQGQAIEEMISNGFLLFGSRALHTDFCM